MKKKSRLATGFLSMGVFVTASERPKALYSRIISFRDEFPSLSCLRPDGLLCYGGDLLPERLLAAYSLGLFPWYEKRPILWWSLFPRCVLPLEDFILPKRSSRYLRNHPFSITYDTSFSQVIQSCAAPRKDEGGTWLSREMQAAYTLLHHMGYAHSVEAWRDGKLVGGLYGIGLGSAFFGESMFHREPEASRAALAGLVSLLKARGCTLLDCQQESPHMMRAGAKLLDLSEFTAKLEEAGLGRNAPEASYSPWSSS